MTLAGPVNAGDCSMLRRELDALVAQRVRDIIVDLAQCDFICSLGLGAIVSAHIRCRHHQGRIKLVKPPPAVVELLGVTRLDRLFEAYGSIEDAVAGCSDRKISASPPETR